MARLDSIGNGLSFTIEINPPRYVAWCKDLVSRINNSGLRQHVAGIYFPQVATEDVVRLGNATVASYVKHETGIETAYHQTPRDENIRKLKSNLRTSELQGLDNVVIIRGDQTTEEKQKVYGRDVYDVDVLGLIRLAREIRGDICIGCGANPSLDKRIRESDVERLVLKQDAGADYALTQGFFDLESFYDYSDKARSYGVKIPIVPAFLIPRSDRNLEVLEGMGVGVTDEVRERMRGKDVSEGLRVVGELMEDLMLNGHRRYHIYSLGDNDSDFAIRIGLIEGMRKRSIEEALQSTKL